MLLLFLRIVPAPDLWTEACIIGRLGARKLYITGNVGVVMRAVMHLEKVLSSKTSKRNTIIVTELPYQPGQQGCATGAHCVAGRREETQRHRVPARREQRGRDTHGDRAEARRRCGRGVEQPPKEDAPPDGVLGELPRALWR